MIINQIQGGKWDAFLRRLLPIKDRSIAPIVASELVGQIVVQEWEPEFFKLRGENLAVGIGSPAAVAAEFSHTKLRNPIDSGSLIILEGFWARSPANTTIALAQVINVATVGFTDVATAFRDMRSGGLPAVGVTVGQVSTENNAALLGGTELARWSFLTTDTKWIPLTFILPPNSEIILRCLTVNIALNITWLWRERGAEPSELVI